MVNIVLKKFLATGAFKVLHFDLHGKFKTFQSVYLLFWKTHFIKLPFVQFT